MDYSKLTFVWPAFAGDSATLVESVGSVAAAAPGARLVVLEDGAAPVTGAARELAGVSYFASDWDRGGNCNGLVNLRNTLGFWQFIAPEGGAVVNVDCDVVVLDAGFLARHDWEARPFGAVCQPAWWWQGATLGVASGKLAELALAVESAERLCPQQGPRWPYDCTLGEVAAAVWGPEALAHWHGYPVGPAVAHYDYASNAPFEGYGEFWTVNFGARGLIRAPEAVKRGLVADTMRGFREWRAAVTAVTQA